MKPYRLAWLLLATATAAVPRAAMANLAWAAQTEAVDCSLGAAEATATFKFKNTGERAVTIVKITTSCSCTKATIAKKTYQPGQSGKLSVRVTLGNLHGVLVRAIHVMMNSGGKGQAKMLRLRILVPELARISPRSLVWRIGSPAAPRMVIVTIPKTHPFRITSVATGDTFMHAKLVEVSPQRRYAIVLWPRSTSGLAGWTVRAETSFLLDGKPVWLTIPVEIFPPPMNPNR